MYIICQNNQHLSYFCVILFICKMRAEGIKSEISLISYKIQCNKVSNMVKHAKEFFFSKC